MTGLLILLAIAGAIAVAVWPPKIPNESEYD